MSPPSHRSLGGARVAPPAFSIASAVLVALLPKCPVCMGLYIAAFSGLGASSLPLEWVWPVAWISLAVGVVLVARTARRRRHVAPLLFTASGALVLVAGRIADAPVALLAVGSALVVVGSMWSVIHRGAFRARRPIAV